MTYTIDQIDKTIKRASEIYSPTTYMGKKLSILKDLRNKLDSKWDLSDAQVNYLENLMEAFSNEVLAKAENWVHDWANDSEIRERGDVISKYYIAQKGWFMEVANVTQSSLNGVVDHPPDFYQFDRMVHNEYAEKVWRSHKAPHRWKAGELVCCRANARTDGWHYYNRVEGLNVHKDPCMVIESGSKPISNASKYDEKRGGCRWVAINPIGSNHIFHVMEKDLKIYRQPKNKAKKK